MTWQLTPVANTNHYLLMKEPEKCHQLPTPFDVNVWSLPQGVYKVVWYDGLNADIETSGVISVCYKKFIRVLMVVTNSIYFSKMKSYLSHHKRHWILQIVSVNISCKLYGHFLDKILHIFKYTLIYMYMHNLFIVWLLLTF